MYSERLQCGRNTPPCIPSPRARRAAPRNNIATAASRPHLDTCLSQCAFVLFEENRGGVERNFASPFGRLTKKQAQVRRHRGWCVGDAGMHCDRLGSGGALGESTVKMHPRSAYHSECSRGSEQTGDHGEEPEDEGATGMQAKYRK